MEQPLLVVGSIALDTLEGPYGRVQDELGGSAAYFSMAASLIGPVRLVAPVGRDAVGQVLAVLRRRPAIDLTGLEVLDAPTYRWTAADFMGSNLDLGSRDSIYDSWQPRLPREYPGWAFVGSMRLDHQVEAAHQLAAAELLASDAMHSYLEAAPRRAAELIEQCSWYFCNSGEFQALGGDPDRPDRSRRAWGLEGLCVKGGPDGLTAYTGGGQLRLPALLAHRVVDTTGAGDSLAGASLARWLQLGGGPESLEDALVHGIACASIAIEDIGLRALARATPSLLAARVLEVRASLAGQP